MFLSFVALFALGLVHNIRYNMFTSNIRDVQLEMRNSRASSWKLWPRLMKPPNEIRYLSVGLQKDVVKEPTRDSPESCLEVITAPSVGRIRGKGMG